MGRSQDSDDSWGKCNIMEPLPRHVAPGVYFAPDGMLTADSLESAIAYLRELAEPSAEGTPSPPFQVDVLRSSRARELECDSENRRLNLSGDEPTRNRPGRVPGR